MAKQVVATSTARMDNGEYISVRKCSEPEADLQQIYEVLKVNHIPIKTKKFVWTQKPNFKKMTLRNQEVSFIIAAMWVRQCTLSIGTCWHQDA